MAWYDEYLQAWDQHDGQRVTSFMTPDATYVDFALGETHTGREDIASWINSMVEEFSTDYSFESVFSFSTDSVYVLEWVLRGTNDRGKAFPATGNRFAIHGASVGELENGLIKRNTDYWSLGEFLMQVGLMPAPAAAGAGG